VASSCLLLQLLPPMPENSGREKEKNKREVKIKEEMR
jgi:hypothetical protein